MRSNIWLFDSTYCSAFVVAQHRLYKDAFDVLASQGWLATAHLSLKIVLFWLCHSLMPVVKAHIYNRIRNTHTECIMAGTQHNSRYTTYSCKVQQ